ncbi:M61 family peptidase [Myxococcus stipitatus DSM 14675]|uniref:M61 family peptidase n=1 Tax=Myxococcus stipitatus (strain DSM 14675 / JCM 12634 / Mx s8) TaxID=1278073 RepID=L7UCU5_MYXSD|nr:PDZ domain-containing protein [Myxococcus stipitatus]AGC44284.1 M61 family peptidase [Myxococcus stipitatus DSM 14675]
MSHTVRYRVSLPRPHTHLVEVEVSFPGGAATLDARMPVWTPGSYLVREFARHVQDVSAVAPDGTPLLVRRMDKQTWRVHAGGQAVTLRYRVYANELTVRTSHVDGTHAYLNGASVFLYTDATRDAEHHVTVEAPAGWSTFCALDSRDGAFIAPDYDTLVDSPIEVGPHTPLTFTVAGVPHDIVVWGDSVADPERLCADFQRLCEVQARLFGGLPMRRYLFLLYLTDKGRGGLEHQASTALLFPRAALATNRGWEDLLTLAAHEYFHLWVVKRVKPRTLVPFDYTQENYTSLLWAFEGTTAYYDNLIVRRSGLMSAPRYLTRLGETLTTLQSTPGRRTQTLLDASMVSWVKHYRPDENSPNSAISYYLKGEVVSALLDLEIRRATRDDRGLDDVLRLLWSRHGDGTGVDEEGVEAAASEVAGTDLKAFFDRALRTTEELDYSVFSHVGLEASFRTRESPGDRGGTPPKGRTGEAKPRGWLGITLKGSATVASVLDGSPAQEAGLYAEDDVVALDGWKADGNALVSRCEDRKPGDTVRVTVFRRDKLLEVPVVLGTKPSEAVWLARVDKPTEAQKAAYQSWLGAPWDEAPGAT